MTNHEPIGAASKAAMAKTPNPAISILAAVLVALAVPLVAAATTGAGSSGEDWSDGAGSSTSAGHARGKVAIGGGSSAQLWNLDLDAAIDATLGASLDRSRRDGVEAVAPAATIVIPAHTNHDLGSLGIADVRAAVLAMSPRQHDAAANEPMHNSGFGHWLKRHWWVPALVGGAVVYTAGESLWDSDSPDDGD